MCSRGCELMLNRHRLPRRPRPGTTVQRSGSSRRRPSLPGSGRCASACLLALAPSTSADSLMLCLQFVGHSSRLQKPGDYITGDIAGNRYLICKDEVTVSSSHAHCQSCHELTQRAAAERGAARLPQYLPPQGHGDRRGLGLHQDVRVQVPRLVRAGLLLQSVGSIPCDTSQSKVHTTQDCQP